MLRWYAFPICTVVFLPSWTGIFMVALPIIAERPQTLVVESDLLLIGAMAVLTSAGTTAMLFSSYPRAGMRRW